MKHIYLFILASLLSACAAAPQSSAPGLDDYNSFSQQTGGQKAAESAARIY